MLLACFQRADTQEAFTIAQVLYLTGQSEVDKTYAFCTGLRSIAEDLSGLTRESSMVKQLTARGFQACTTYSEYSGWLSRLTGMRPKAMDVFNQTVAVKDIQSLNRFIRDHMLEAHPWRERIEGLLAHFDQLSQAHQALVRARRQIELLAPLEIAAHKHHDLATAAHATQQQIDAIDSFFRQYMVQWIGPQIAGCESQMAQIGRRKQGLQIDIERLEETQRQLRNEIESAGGERLRQLPLLLETQQALLRAKRRERQRLQQALETVGSELVGPVSLATREGFAELPTTLMAARQQLSQRAEHLSQQRLQWLRELDRCRVELEDVQSQLGEATSPHVSNVPGGLDQLRAAIAQRLEVPPSELLFACEVLGLAPEQRDWQPALEMVLRRLAVSLLVPEHLYPAVSQDVEQHLLRDQRGRGQRLVYVRIPERLPALPATSLHEHSLVRKLEFRPPTSDSMRHVQHWLAGELRRRFDYRCCESLEEFQRASGLALTRQRHVKQGNQHEKDDRPRSSEPQHFVLGGDATRSVHELHDQLRSAQENEQALREQLARLEGDAQLLSTQLAAIDTALAVPEFDLIDTEQHAREIAALEAEGQLIEDADDRLRHLRHRLDECIAQRFAAQQARDAQIAAESQLSRALSQLTGAAQQHAEVLSQRQTQNVLEVHREAFDTLAAALLPRLQSVRELTEFAELQTQASLNLQQRLHQLRLRGEPLREDGIRAMQRFLSENPEERNDLQADWKYVDAFRGLLEQLRHEDLPRHEHRFRQRLNDKVLQELGIFHAALHCEQQEILAKIDTLNGSLEQLEYRPGTLMRLEPRPVKDREIADFQNLLRECLADAFDGQAEADEARFRRMERLLERLREEERWREKVTDVRRWFDFVARELDIASGQERSCYEDSSGQSGGEKAKLAFTILVAAIAYQFDIDPHQPYDHHLHFVVVDEMFSKVDDRYADYALQLFEKFGLQLLIVAPLDAKARVTEPYVGCYLHVVKNEQTHISDVISLSAGDYQRALAAKDATASRPGRKPR